MTRSRKIAIVLASLIVLALAGLLAWVLPQHRVVYVQGTEVRRGDGSVVQSRDMPPRTEPGRDVYYLHTASLDRTQVHVFRNDDTGFGFPWYFKMDAAEVQGRAQLLARKEDQLALVTYYGWRVPVLQLFPNAVDIEAWDSPQEPLPIFNLTFLALLAIVMSGSAWRLRRWRRAREARAAGVKRPESP